MRMARDRDAAIRKSGAAVSLGISLLNLRAPCLLGPPWQVRPADDRPAGSQDYSGRRRMLPPFQPFTKRPIRRKAVKRAAPAGLLRDLIAIEAHSIKGERLNLKPDRLPANGRLRILDRT
jgi:hypothetical protein